MIFILAGSYAEYMGFIRHHGLTSNIMIMRRVRYLVSPDYLRGFYGGALVCVGTWRQRSPEFLEELHIEALARSFWILEGTEPDYRVFNPGTYS